MEWLIYGDSIVMIVCGMMMYVVIMSCMFLFILVVILLAVRFSIVVFDRWNSMM